MSPTPAYAPSPAPPKYAQVAAALQERLRRCRTGQLLPTQPALAREYGTSLITVKRALNELARSGCLESVRGRGTVVLRPVPADDRRGVASWTDAMTGLGREPRTAWTRLAERVPPPDVARALRIRPRRKTVLLTRLRTLDGAPFCLMTNELPLDLVPALAAEGLAEESLYGWLKRRCGLVPAAADEEVEARAPTLEEARALGPDAKIVVVVRRHTRTADGRPLEVAEMVAPAHRYRYRVEIVKR